MELYHLKIYIDDLLHRAVGSAGLPILESLKRNKLNHILCVVTRYFGGIKLRKSILTRTYAKVVKECVDKNLLQEEIKCYIVYMETDYTKNKKLEYKLENYEIIEKNFKEKITYKVIIPISDIDKFSMYNTTILDTIIN